MWHRFTNTVPVQEPSASRVDADGSPHLSGMHEHLSGMHEAEFLSTLTGDED